MFNKEEYKNQLKFMGLDIYLYKVVKATKKDAGSDNIYYLDEHSELEVFDKYAFEFEDEFYDFDKALVKYNRKHEDTNYRQYTNDKEGNDIIILEFPDKTRITLKYSELETYKVMRKAIVVKEIGYQRKGANSQFYKDGIWDKGEYVTDLKTLNEHWIKYFTIFTPYSDNNSEHNLMFKDNIVDKFIEGRSFVCYC